MIKRAVDDLLLFKQADQVSKPPTTLKTFQEAFGKGLEDDWSSEIKYFMPDSPITSFWNMK